MKKLRFLFAMIFLVSLAVSCENEPTTSDDIIYALQQANLPVTTGGGGNLNCEDLQTYINNLTDLPDVSFVGGSFKQDYPFTGSWPEGLVVTVLNNKEVSFTYTSNTWCVGAVIVKGGNNANVYIFPEGTQSGSGLISPLNDGGNVPELSNLTFCLIECEDEPCWQEETAFGGDTEGSGSAWWYIFDTQGLDRQSIFAGQKEIDGAYVEWNEDNDVLTIVLGDNLKLQDIKEVTKLNPKGKTTTSLENEQVKVQGYAEIPLGRPSAGGFTLYKGRNLVIQGNGSRYYVIHLDVEVKVECEE
jgi:hypothetical protein